MSIPTIHCNLFIATRGEKIMTWIFNKRCFITYLGELETKPPVGSQNDVFMHFLAINCNGWLEWTSFLLGTIGQCMTINERNEPNIYLALS